MQKINKSPVLTSNNFGINYFFVENVFEKLKPFKNFKITNCDTQEKEPENITYPICEFSVRPNVCKKLCLNESTAKVEFNLDGDSVFNEQKIEVKSGLKTKIIFDFSAQNSFLFNKIIFDLKEESFCDAVFVINTKNTNNFLNFESVLQKNAKLNLTFATFSNTKSIFNVFSKNLGENSETNLNTMYITREGGKIDLNLFVQNIGKNTKANINSNGALLDSAEKSFKGTIDFLKGAQKSFGAEKEYCVLLSSGAISKSLPMLLCGEEDVTGSHSSSSGKLDENQLFYLMSRGLNKKEATSLLLKAKFNSGLKQIFDEELKNKILEKIDRSVYGKSF
ncbi:MAG: SufD family Fe-S cluster assembly protein [Clostridia bacterium]|nr:SufD family Fe-S cluster assembly protein [Clostridia bacterium]